MRLTEFTRPNTRGLAGYELKQRGYEKLGKGAYASIWAKPGENTIVKLFDNDDVPYQKYISLISSNPNDHFPKLKGKIVKINSKYNAIRMEKLEPISDSDFMKLGLGPVYHYLNYLKDPNISPLSDENKQDVLTKIDQLESDQPGIKKAFEILAKNFKSFDIKPDNFMLRGNIIVIIDPVL